jgi:deoxyribonuclease-4
VSTAGGLVRAHERGVERGCEAIQIWGQSPRQWRPGRWKEDDVAAFRELMADGPIKSVVIHSIYLINCASTDREMRRKSAASLIHALRTGDEIGAGGVVLHPGSARGEPNEEALPRAAEIVKHALDESGRCPLLFEATPWAARSRSSTASSSCAAAESGSASASTPATCSRRGSTSRPPTSSPA